MRSLLALNFPLLLAVILGLNTLTWGVYRWDKAHARNGGRRVPERTLLTLAACGGIVGAFAAIYGHRQRHKAQKVSFLIHFTQSHSRISALPSLCCGPASTNGTMWARAVPISSFWPVLQTTPIAPCVSVYVASFGPSRVLAQHAYRYERREQRSCLRSNRILYIGM